LEKVLLVPARLIIIAEHTNETWFRARASVCNKWVSISSNLVAIVALTLEVLGAGGGCDSWNSSCLALKVSNDVPENTVL
jgi:hypothetical protein